MRSRLGVLVFALAASLVAGCSGASSFSGSAIPPGGLPSALQSSSEKTISGLYVGGATTWDVLAYPAQNRKNGPPRCQIYDPGSTVNNLAVDPNGNLIIPTSGDEKFDILVYDSNKLCGKWLATLPDLYGQPTNAASNDAVNGTIAVGNIFDVSSENGGSGSITLCTIKAGCTQNLGNPNLLFAVGGVAMDLSGNCWASGISPEYSSSLVYFANCAGNGVAATGVPSGSGLGGLDIDVSGNIVAVGIPSSLYVFKGCNPACTVVGGPFPLRGSVTFGHLNENSTQYATGDYQSGQIDMYKYSSKSLTFEYSFNNGLSASYGVESAAFRPRSKE
jgi:hypothetical protein